MNPEQYSELVRLKMSSLVDSKDVQWLPDPDEIDAAMELAVELQSVCAKFEKSFSPRTEITMPLAVAMLASINLNFYKPCDESEKDPWWTVLYDVANTGELWPDLRVLCDYYEGEKEITTFQNHIKTVSKEEYKIQSVDLAMKQDEIKIDINTDISNFSKNSIPGYTPLLSHLIEKAVHWKEHYSDTMSAHDIEDFYEAHDVDIDFDGLKNFLIENNLIESGRADLKGEEFFDSKSYQFTNAALIAYAAR